MGPGASARGSFRRSLYAKRRKVKEDNKGSTDAHDKDSLLGRLEGKVKSKTLNKVKSIMGGKKKRYA
jgi:hypothetical protein